MKPGSLRFRWYDTRMRRPTPAARLRLVSLLALGTGLGACAAHAPPKAPPAHSTQEFENPGGMWMPSQLTAHEKRLKALGLQVDPSSLTDPTSDLLSAVVSLGGCSASFVSSTGLIATNHHCATGALQYNSTPESNLLQNGFVASTLGGEKSNGPQARVYVTRRISDITPIVAGGLESIVDDRERYKQLERNQKEAIAVCEQGRPEIRCSVPSFFEGSQYYLVEQLEIRDVRLVWAPPRGVGNYGGEVDNWRWPRHTGDVSFFRAYVGPDGKPADFSPNNVPYRSEHFLKLASQPLSKGDFVFVAGYPGRTQSLRTSQEVTEAITWAYPWRQSFFENYLARIEVATKGDPEGAIRATSYVRGFGNALTNVRGQLEGLVKGGLAERKARDEEELRAFIEADPERKARWGSVLSEIAREVATNATYRVPDSLLRDELLLPSLVSAASKIVRMAEERAKPDAERHPDYQDRNFPRHLQAFRALSTSYNRKVDEALLTLALERTSARPESERGPAFSLFLSAARIARVSAETPKAVDALYGRSQLATEAYRVDLLTNATTKSLQRSPDALIQLALKLRPIQREVEERQERLAGKMLVLKRRYMQALRAFRGDSFAPDANGTLRITYGTVRGYQPSASSPIYEPFTTLSQMVAKDQGRDPFDTPPAVLAMARSKTFGPYVDTTLKDVPVDFLSDLHITGGNSGSATLNAKGELVGLVFDGNYEAMASDWLFVPSVTRSIHVDLRYILWLLDGPLSAPRLLKELGVPRSLGGPT